MNIFGFSSILIIFSNTLLSIVLFRRSGTKIAKIWGWVCISAVIWGIGGLVVSFLPQSLSSQALFWWQFAWTGVIFAPVFFLCDDTFCVSVVGIFLPGFRYLFH